MRVTAFGIDAQEGSGPVNPLTRPLIGAASFTGKVGREVERPAAGIWHLHGESHVPRKRVNGTQFDEIRGEVLAIGGSSAKPVASRVLPGFQCLTEKPVIGFEPTAY